jgi:hypothetical protein
MLRNALSFAAVVTVIAATLGSGAQAQNHNAKPSHNAEMKPNLEIFDKDGNKIFNDHKADGKACALGEETSYNPKTGEFTKHPVVKSCNF